MGKPISLLGAVLVVALVIALFLPGRSGPPQTQTASATAATFKYSLDGGASDGALRPVCASPGRGTSDGPC